MMDIKKDVPCVYFISDGQNHCKIGVASDIQSRFNTLQVGSAYELTIRHIKYTDSIDEAYEIEKEYHSALHDYIVRGEWYKEDAVERYYNFGEVESDKVYMCDVCPEFDIKDALKLFIICLESKNTEEAAERYDNEMPKYWKDFDSKRITEKAN